jgi:hypothetical protein
MRCLHVGLLEMTLQLQIKQALYKSRLDIKVTMDSSCTNADRLSTPQNVIVTILPAPVPRNSPSNLNGYNSNLRPSSPPQPV